MIDLYPINLCRLPYTLDYLSFVSEKSSTGFNISGILDLKINSLKVFKFPVERGGFILSNAVRGLRMLTEMAFENAADIFWEIWTKMYGL